MMDAQPCDVHATTTDTTELEKYKGFRPRTSVEEGVSMFLEWYMKIYKH